jgi:hypothetical protein
MNLDFIYNLVTTKDDKTVVSSNQITAATATQNLFKK